MSRRACDGHYLLPGSGRCGFTFASIDSIELSVKLSVPPEDKRLLLIAAFGLAGVTTSRSPIRVIREIRWRRGGYNFAAMRPSM